MGNLLLSLQERQDLLKFLPKNLGNSENYYAKNTKRKNSKNEEMVDRKENELIYKLFRNITRRYI